MENLKLAVTGGIASGKSVVCSELKNKGLPVLILDDLVNTVYRENKDFYTTLVNWLGPQILNKDQSIDKRKVAQLVFKEASSLDDLKKKLYPFLKQEIFSFQCRHLVSLVEVPLLYEEGWEIYFDYVILVCADKQIRIRRCLDRGLSVEDTELRMSYQWKDSLKKDKANKVVNGNFNIKDLRRQCELLWIEISSMMEW